MNESGTEIDVTVCGTTEEFCNSSITENKDEIPNSIQEPVAEPEIDENEKITENSSITEELSEEPSMGKYPSQDTLQTQMKNLDIKMDNLLQLFQDRLLYDQHKDLINERQYQELEGFRNGLIEKLQKPIIMDLISEIDDSVKLGTFYVQKKEEYEANKNPEELEKLFEKLLKLYLGVVPNLCELLEKHDVTSWQTEPGEQFDPKIHSVLKKTMTGNPELHKTICKSLRFGFKLNDKIIRREMVDVFVLQNPSPSETSSTSPLN